MKQWLQHFARAREGSVMMIVGLGMVAIIGSVGVAVDVARAQYARAKLQNAADAAGLAVGASLNSADLNAVALKYVNINFANGVAGASITEVATALSEDKQTVTITIKASMPTSFMRIFGETDLPLGVNAEITRVSRGLELAMVLDITGSMAGTKIDALKTASNDLLEIMFGHGKTTADRLWIGIVPFSMGVNTGAAHTDWLDSAQYSGLDWGTTTWRGCTEARWTAGRDVTDDTPATEPFLAYYWQDDANNNWRTANVSTTTTTLCGPTGSGTCRCTSSGGNYTCGSTTSGNTTTTISCSGSGNNNTRKCTSAAATPDGTYSYNITSSKGPNTYCPTSEVERLTNDRAALETSISNLVANGGTHIPEGAIWGWRMLSPQWRGLWGGTMDANNLPLDYNSELMMKAVIIMTDGENTMYSTSDGAYGYTGDNHVGMTAPYSDSKAADKLDDKLATICTNMKAQGIIVYTILFDLAGSTGTQNLLRNCATQPDYFFNSPDSATLQQSFASIGDSLSNLRISK